MPSEHSLGHSKEVTQPKEPLGQHNGLRWETISATDLQSKTEEGEYDLYEDRFETHSDIL